MKLSNLLNENKKGMLVFHYDMNTYKHFEKHRFVLQKMGIFDQSSGDYTIRANFKNLSQFNVDRLKSIAKKLGKDSQVMI